MAAMDWSQRVEALYRADADRLWRTLYAWSADADIANESVAEAYAQALRRGPEVRDPGRMGLAQRLPDRRRCTAGSPLGDVSAAERSRL